MAAILRKILRASSFCEIASRDSRSWSHGVSITWCNAGVRTAVTARFGEAAGAARFRPCGLSYIRLEVALHEMLIYGVSFDLVGKQPIVLLKTADGNKFLPIWIGHPEAAAILMKLQSQAPPRPMTHDLLSDMLEQLEAQVVRITVTELRENTFYAQITVQQDGREIEVDSRPSDAIALAIRAEAPIFAAERVIEESAIEFEGEDVDQDQLDAEVAKFRNFLDEVTPEDFAVENGEEDA